MKAVLVIDMPTECNDEKCPICYDYAMCSYLNRWIEDGKPNDCPLRPLPSKDYWHKKDYADGWNDCLKEITENTEKVYKDDLYEDWMFFDKGETE